MKLAEFIDTIALMIVGASIWWIDVEYTPTSRVFFLALMVHFVTGLLVKGRRG